MYEEFNFFGNFVSTFLHNLSELPTFDAFASATTAGQSHPSAQAVHKIDISSTCKIHTSYTQKQDHI